MIASLEEIMRVMQRHDVRCIVIGGWAAILHGSARSTSDVDLVYARDRDNLNRLAAALASHRPYLRGAPPGLPFIWNQRTLQAGLNFTLTTAVGDLDLLGEVTGGGTYEQLLPFTQELTAFGMTCRVVTLERLIQLKRAAGRPKDLEVIAELQALLEERPKTAQSS
jgi:predicted nucleotidyltransferase